MTVKVLAPCPYTLLPSGILIVEPHEGLLAARSRLLAAADQCIGISSACVSEVERSEDCEVALAVLSESLGYAMLSKIARTVRKHWPRARILIFGSSLAAIEDSLYDARIDHRSRAEDLLAALLMLTEYPWNQRATPAAILEDGRVGRLLSGVAFKQMAESDPAKRPASKTEVSYTRGPRSDEQHFSPVSLLSVSVP